MSVSTASNSVSQFGLYRTIDSRTEEFLKLSKKRQIRQGCACAAVTAAITVTIVIVILLIFEYAIAVESNLVQIGGRYRMLNETIVTNDTPVADRLDRTYLGFDQDYFEQMPLLVNALQENSYSDPAVETPLPSYKKGRYLHTEHYTTSPTVQIGYRTPRTTSVLGKTSARPFIFEYRSPTPSPFHKNFNSRSWVESYRNAQRLKNLEQVISYLEKTINAKFGDLHTLPSSNHIAFTGVLQPASTENKIEKPFTLDSISQSSNRFQIFQKTNHQADPYFNFKPDSPGDVNLLADGQYKFSLVPTPSFISKNVNRIPLFRPIPRYKGCIGNKCSSHIIEKKVLFNSKEGSAEITSAETGFLDKPKSFNVMLNLYPITSTPNVFNSKGVIPDNIYITTSRPQFQLRRKSVGSSNRRRVYVRRIKRPRLLSASTTAKSVSSESVSSENVNSSTEGAKVLLHFDIFSKTEEPTSSTTESPTITTELPFTASQEVVHPPYVPTCSPLCAVEDFHIGSSGVIPVELRTYPSIQTAQFPQATTVTPFFETLASSEVTQIWTTAPTEVLKFSQEDARIPEEYLNLRTDEPENLQTEAARRNSGSFEDDDDERRKILIVKLRNYLQNNTVVVGTENSVVEENQVDEQSYDEIVTEETVYDGNNQEAIDVETTTVQTYVPQINGHYRSVQNDSKPVNMFEENNVHDRKSRLEVVSFTLSKKLAPKYVEINRNRTNNISTDNE